MSRSTSVLPPLKVMHHVYTCFHGITHTLHTSTNWQWTSTCATPTTCKNQNTLHTSHFAIVLVDHPPLIWLHSDGDILIWCPLTAVQLHSLHVPITCLDVQICSQMIPFLVKHADADTLFFWTSLCTHQRQKTQNMLHTTRPQQRVQQGCIKICHSFWTIIMPLV